MKFLLIFVLIIFLLGSFSKQILRFLLGRYMKKVKEQYEAHLQKQDNMPGARPQGPAEGEMYVHKETRPSAANGRKDDNYGGEYIDFEEVK